MPEVQYFGGLYLRYQIIVCFFFYQEISEKGVRTIPPVEETPISDSCSFSLLPFPTNDISTVARKIVSTPLLSYPSCMLN